MKEVEKEYCKLNIAKLALCPNPNTVWEFLVSCLLRNDTVRNE